MALLVVHPWAPFLTGMLAGCWIGAAIGCAGVLLLVGRRVRQLETINLLLRTKLKVREKPQRTGASAHGQMLVMPIPSDRHRAESPMSRIARIH
jgi:hypothetical protein